MGSRKAVPVDTDRGIDLKNPDLYTDEKYHALFALLRAEEPVYWNPEADASGFWAITRYDDVVRVVQDPETFSSALENGGNRLFDKQEVAAGRGEAASPDDGSASAHAVKLLADFSLIPSAVREILRWAAPLMHMRRTAMKEAEIGGRTIRKGDKVVVWFNSANRDEQKWMNAQRFDVTRFADKAVPHLAFGHGPHHCLGWRFAELQLKVALEELLRQLPDIRASGSVRRLRSNFIGGIKELPVTFTPRG